MNVTYLQPLMTEKSLALAQNGKYQFITPLHATKSQIAKQVADHFSVTVESVHTARMPQVNVYFRRRLGQKAAWKKATVQLKTGESIAEFSLPAETSQIPSPEEKETAPKATESQITVRSKSKKGAGK